MRRAAARASQLHRHVEAGVDRAVGIARSVTRQPLLMAAAAAALMVLKPARALRYLARGAVVVSMVRRVLGWLDRPSR